MFKKIGSLFIIVILLMLIICMPVNAMYINSTNYSYSSFTIYQTVGGNNYYNVKIYVDDNALSDDMTLWYNSFDNLLAEDHFYMYQYPIVFIDDLGILTDGIYGLFVDYNLAGSDLSTIYFIDLDGVNIGAIAMDELTADMQVIMIRASILDPYEQGLADGRAEQLLTSRNYYTPIIAELTEDLETWVSYYNEGFQVALDEEYEQAQIDMFTNGSAFYDFQWEDSYDWSHGYGEGFGDGSAAIASFALIPQALYTLGNFIFAIELSEGFTVGTLTMIPISFYFFKWFLKVIGK